MAMPTQAQLQGAIPVVSVRPSRLEWSRPGGKDRVHQDL